jgi:hypothetical protein
MSLLVKEISINILGINERFVQIDSKAGASIKE